MNQTAQTITSYFVALVSLMTATGVFMHDVRIDKAIAVSLHGMNDRAVAAAKSDAGKVNAFVKGDAHTHPDFNPGRSLMNGFTYRAPNTPGIPPREREHTDRNLLNKYAPRGRHAFDNSNLPIVE